jgi:hypothetical protein
MQITSKSATNSASALLAAMKIKHNEECRTAGRNHPEEMILDLIQ